ncbi:MAG: LysM peptidoglycan-binding domain-containing M23 family metallopeptidase [Desulfomonile tiedjei]|nr:LysM peptidoglycan-binding domain-containing M23 family metallopeptidase [Desulfomonile tiedjei]
MSQFKYIIKILLVLLLPFVGACSSSLGLVRNDSSSKPPEKIKIKVAQKDPTPARSEDDGAFHIVGAGETLRHICDVYGLEMGKVAKINNLKTDGELKAGETVFLPSSALLADNDQDKNSGWKAQCAASGASSTKELGSVVVKALRGQRDPSVPNLKFPVAKGVMTSPFGHRWGRFHKGLDIAAAVGTPVLSCADGRVIFTGSRKRFRRYGNTVLVYHGQGVYTYYAHLNQILVKKNDKVQQGQKIALVGNTGRSTGPHLHLEVRVKNNLYNPLAYFSPSELVGTRVAKRFADSPMGPVRARWDIPELLTARR